jgi:acyl-CoA synthetase (AMP-forming)/AMP-acid ligase II
MLGVPDRDSYDVSPLRCCVSGGAALPVEVRRRFEAAFGCIILEGYGLSESAPVPRSTTRTRPRSCSGATPGLCCQPAGRTRATPAVAPRQRDP